MLSTKITSYLKIWEIEDDPNTNNVKVVRVSSSRKVKEDSNYDKSLEEHGIAKNGYVSTTWYNLRFVGKAFNQLSKYNVQVGDVITNVEASIEKEPYWDSNNQAVTYPKNIKMTVFGFELPGSTSEEGQPAKTPKNIDRAPIVSDEPANISQDYAVDEDDDMPF